MTERQYRIDRYYRKHCPWFAEENAYLEGYDFSKYEEEEDLENDEEDGDEPYELTDIVPARGVDLRGDDLPENEEPLTSDTSEKD